MSCSNNFNFEKIPALVGARRYRRSSLRFRCTSTWQQPMSTLSHLISRLKVAKSEQYRAKTAENLTVCQPARSLASVQQSRRSLLLPQFGPLSFRFFLCHLLVQFALISTCYTTPAAHFAKNERNMENGGARASICAEGWTVGRCTPTVNTTKKPMPGLRREPEAELTNGRMIRT